MTEKYRESLHSMRNLTPNHHNIARRSEKNVKSDVRGRARAL